MMAWVGPPFLCHILRDSFLARVVLLLLLLLVLCSTHGQLIKCLLVYWYVRSCKDDGEGARRKKYVCSTFDLNVAT